MADEVQEDWGWYASRDGERYDIGPDTREAVIAEALDSQYGAHRDETKNEETGETTYGPWVASFHIMEAQPAGTVELADYFEVADWLEDLENGPFYDLGDPDGDSITSNVTKAQMLDLEAHVRPIISAWQERHKLVLNEWRFPATRNAEQVSMPIPPKDAAT